MPKYENPLFPKQEPSGKTTDLTGVWPVYQQPSVFEWVNVDPGILRAALHTCTVKGVTLAFGTAMGGRGVVVTLYMGTKQNPKRFALTPAELHTLLMGIIEQWGSTSEDLGQVFGYTTENRHAAD